MSKVKVQCIIQNPDDKEHIITKGIKKGSTLSFYDDQHVKHALTFSGESLRYVKTGSIEMDFLFEKEAVHPGVYRIKEGAFHFKVITRHLSITDRVIHVDYVLKQEDLVVNRGHLHVTYEEI